MTAVSVVLDVSLRSIAQGPAIMFIGLLALLLAAAVFLKNYAAGMMWGMSVLSLLLVDIFSLGLELFWTAISVTIVLLIAGMAVRWSA